MSEVARRDRFRKQSWAAPGGAHDTFVRLLKIALPALVGVLLAYLAMAPLTHRQEISFVLDKKKVDVAPERMRVQAAEYRGVDSKGRPFTLAARSAIQPTSKLPLVDIHTMAARIQLNDGPATVRADSGRYNMDTQVVDVFGPVALDAANNYRLRTRDVAVDLDDQKMHSRGSVDGSMPLGIFSADHLDADLPERQVVLTGNARLHITQGVIK